MLMTAPTNADRAEWAQTAVDAFMALGGTDEDDAIPDLITNLLHLARRNAAAAAQPFDATEYALARALMHDLEQSDDEEGDDEEEPDTSNDCAGCGEELPLGPSNTPTICRACGHYNEVTN